MSQGGTVELGLELARRSVQELGLRVVLLADYAYTVAPVGLERFLDRARAAHVCATLVHALPDRDREHYVCHSRAIGLGRVMTFFATSNEAVRQRAYQETEGFVYIVSRFGPSGGGRATNAPGAAERLRRFRGESEKPLALGFGIQSPADIEQLRGSGIDAAVVGSAGARLIERHLDAPLSVAPAVRSFVSDMLRACRWPHSAADGMRAPS
jgi:tryptophan synthase alpha chain